LVLPESLAPELRRSFELRRAKPLGTLLQMRKYPAVIGLAAALFLWQLGHQVLPSTWAFYTMLKFRWSEAAVGASLAFVGTIMAVGPPLMTQLFGHFSADQAPLRFPGAAFACAALLTVGSLLLFLRAIRSAGAHATVAHEPMQPAVGERPPAPT